MGKLENNKHMLFCTQDNQVLFYQQFRIGTEKKMRKSTMN